MFRLKDRKQADLCLAPTHEEIFAEIASHEIRSYRDLPQVWYQIQTKLRDEMRSRSGVLRGRQFIMKDAYSFDVDWEGLDQSYKDQRDAYVRVFQRCGLDVVTVSASAGIMGGSESEEFMVISDAGEDRIVVCKGCGYAANTEVATSSPTADIGQSRLVEKILTPGMKTIKDVSAFLELPPSRLMKSLLLITGSGPVMVLIRGDDELNETKLEAVLGQEFRAASPEEVLAITGAEAGFIGPVGLEGVKVIADLLLRGVVDLTTGANETDYHLIGLEAGRDFSVDEYQDVRSVKSGEQCVQCDGSLDIVSAIEVGHIFKLGIKYSSALGATYLDQQGQEHPIVMGSYGIGVERIVAAAIEQHGDDMGIVWPLAIAPYAVHILPINMSHQESVELGEQLYGQLRDQHVDALLDDREERAGVKFKDADLIGLPIRVTIGERGLKEGLVEIRIRASGETIKVECSDVLAEIQRVMEDLTVRVD
jgi:prolyl-tRNA synthetase